MVYLENRKKIIIVILTFTLLGIILIFITYKLSPSKLNLDLRRENYLAKIIAVETNLLKAWQQSKGLRRNLNYQSSGNDVVLLQKMLSQDPNIYPEQRVTGYYGELTRQAVIRFQKEYGLPETGIVDSATREKLNEVFLSFLCPEQTLIYPEFLLKKVNRQFSLPNDYVPPSLENVSNKVKTIGIVCLRQDVVPYLVQMFKDAQKNGVYLAVTSGYRKPEIQKYLYDFWLRLGGSAVLDSIAKPGHSEHQLGTTVDLTDSSIGYAMVDERFGESVGGRWLSQNAHKYGFTMSYPKGKEKITGYRYEPWHWRFVGKDVATILYSQNLAFNETNFDIQEKPYPRIDIKEGLRITANAVLSIFVDEYGKEHTLLEKNKEIRMAIADMTDLMTALVASEIYKADDKIVIDESALKIKAASGNYSSGDTFFFQDALHLLLLRSDNEVTLAIAKKIGLEAFVEKMNEKSTALGLNNTRYFNPVGVEPDTGNEEINYSSAYDIYTLIKYLFEKKKDIFSVLQKKEYQFNEVSRGLKINLQNTNRLITSQNTSLPVLAGKIESTSKTKSNLVIVSGAPSKGYIISVVLASNDSFRDMEELLKYIKNSFVW